MSNHTVKTKIGRPKRIDPTSKLNLLVSRRAKRRAFKLAGEDDFSVGRLFEKLVEKKWKIFAAAHPKEAAQIDGALRNGKAVTA